MTLDKIIAISGKPGLFFIQNQSKGGLIVEALADGKKLAVNSNNNISLLSEIAIFTYAEDKPLSEVFQAISDKENGEKTINHKESSKVLLDYFEEVLPDFDQERVYASNIKKVIQWYNILVEKGVSFKLETAEEDQAAEEEK